MNNHDFCICAGNLLGALVGSGALQRSVAIGLANEMAAAADPRVVEYFRVTAGLLADIPVTENAWRDWDPSEAGQ
ncbi:hypothetical protein [Rhizobium sp. Root482]|uniref:hypothetical protein n=1 Tax=Rhizobium sp. Root482 TaxID=1736543 RepID=UPI0006F32A0F|nr:hypothetical protein [Rhizobium sp. Root482]KQY12619.1 hypothetical protein ASD31_15425 [Rhizobium sp. Root482]